MNWAQKAIAVLSDQLVWAVIISIILQAEKDKNINAVIVRDSASVDKEAIA